MEIKINQHKGNNNPKTHTNTDKQISNQENKTFGFIKHGNVVKSVVWDDCKIVKETCKMDFYF